MHVAPMAIGDMSIGPWQADADVIDRREIEDAAQLRDAARMHEVARI